VRRTTLFVVDAAFQLIMPARIEFCRPQQSRDSSGDQDFMLRVGVGVGLPVERFPHGGAMNFRIGLDGAADAFALGGHSLPENGLVVCQTQFEIEEALNGVNWV
jgi:hypothetical protein